MEKRLKHLELIQDIINRMAKNHFVLKGWSITLVSALIALGTQNSNSNYFLIAYLPTCFFWLMDGYYLSQERMFISLYNDVRKLPENKIDFSMDAKPYHKGRNTWFRSVFSLVHTIFYGVLILTILIVRNKIQN